MAMTAEQIAAVSPIPVGVWRDDYHRYFYGSRGPLPSVTTITKVVDRSGPLVGWAKRETARCAVDNLDMLNQLAAQDNGKEAAKEWLRGIPDYIRDNAGETGTRVHDLIHRYTLGETIDPQGIEVPYLRAYRKALEYVRPEIILSEAMLINDTLGYGGTLDSGWMLDGVPTLLDVKTGNRVYDEVALQLSGYDMGEFTGTPESPDKQGLPQWQRYAVLHLQPDDWELIPITVDDESRAAFRAALGLYGYIKGYAPWSQGRPIKEGAQ